MSLAQLIVDAAEKGDYGLIVDNPVKLALSFISIGFDLLFMTQHYYLYRKSNGYAQVLNGNQDDEAVRTSEVDADEDR